MTTIHITTTMSTRQLPTIHTRKQQFTQHK